MGTPVNMPLNKQALLFNISESSFSDELEKLALSEGRFARAVVSHLKKNLPRAVGGAKGEMKTLISDFSAKSLQPGHMSKYMKGQGGQFIKSLRRGTQGTKAIDMHRLYHKSGALGEVAATRRQGSQVVKSLRSGEMVGPKGYQYKRHMWAPVDYQKETMLHKYLMAA